MLQTTTNLVLRCADPQCGVEFIPHKYGQKYHSPKCRKRAWMRRHRPQPGAALACPRCGASLALHLRPDG